MGRPSEARVDAGFEFVRALRHIERHWDDYRDPAFWTRLNPHLTVSATPFRSDHATFAAVTPDVVDRALTQLDTSGFFATPPVVPESRMAPMRRAMDTLAELGIPTGFAAVYDEYYQCFDGLDALFTPVLGEGYRWVAHGLWAFRVPPGDQAISGLTAPSPPHRDSMGPDPLVLAGKRPGIMTVWAALTDVTPADSCIYVVPKFADKAFATSEREVTMDQFDLQDVRAVPVAAGSVVGWSTHLVHWGSRSTPDAIAPRMSITMYLQRADMPPFDASVFDKGGPVPLDSRLRWVLQALGAHELIPRLFPD